MTPKKFIQEVMQQLNGFVAEGSLIRFELAVGLAYSRETGDYCAIVGVGDTKICFEVIAGGATLQKPEI